VTGLVPSGRTVKKGVTVVEKDILEDVVRRVGKLERAPQSAISLASRYDKCVFESQLILTTVLIVVSDESRGIYITTCCVTVNFHR
jgi:hypothetical protein